VARSPRRWALACILAAAALLPACSGAPVRPVFGPADRLVVRDLRVGAGMPADSGMVATIHFELRVADSDRIVDSSYDRNQPFSFRIGLGLVIRGLDLGIVGMRVHGLRQLIIPPEMAYGGHGYPPLIPQNATLVMKVELLDLKP